MDRPSRFVTSAAVDAVPLEKVSNLQLEELLSLRI